MIVETESCKLENRRTDFKRLVGGVIYKSDSHLYSLRIRGHQFRLNAKETELLHAY